MSDPLETQLEKLRASLALLESQRALLGDAILPALDAVRQQIAALQDQRAAAAPPAEERRLVTILFTDVVGSTALAEKLDPEEWRHIIARLHATAGNLIAGHHGTVAQYLGDGLLAFFGAQESSEQDAENAIRAALEIQKDSNLQLRAGIHTGLVVVGELGAESHKEFTATGDAMNLAARLQSAAPPGGVLVSYDTYRYVRGVFEVTPRPPLTVKGKAEPLQTYLVRRAKPRAFRQMTRGVAGIDTRTVGREPETNTLRQAYVDAYQNRRVVWAQLLGEAGVGKSRLLDDMREWLELREETVRVLRARAFAGDETQPFALVRRILFDRFQIAEDAPLAQAEARWVEQFAELGGRADLEAAHALGLLVGLRFDDSPYIGAMRNDPAQVRGRAFVVSRELLHAVRRQDPVVMYLEDLQWADSSSVEWLVEMTDDQATPEGERVNGLFVLATARPDWNIPGALQARAVDAETFERAAPSPEACLSLFVRVPLAPLSDRAARELVLELLRNTEGVPDDVVQLLVERSEGIPYYAEEMINYFVDRGIIDRTSEPWRFVTGRLRESPLPTTLQHLLLTRLSGLSDAERAALQRGAIFGRHFWSGGLEALGVRGSAEVLGHLQPRGLVQQEPESALAGDTEWSFAQTLLREVTYESVLKRERAQLHKKAAEWLEVQARQAGRVDEFAGLLGEHCERAGDLLAAADWYIASGARARAQGAPLESKKFLDRALELLPPVERERRWRALLEREDALVALGELRAWENDLSALLELAEAFDDDDRRAEAYLRRAEYERRRGDSRRARGAAEQALAAARRVRNALNEVKALSLAGQAQMNLGETEEGVRRGEEALVRARELGDAATLALVLYRAAFCWAAVPNYNRAAQLQSEQIEIDRRLGNRRGEAIGLGNLAIAYLGLGLIKQARGMMERVLELAQALGERRMRAYTTSNLGEICALSGDLRTARRLVEQALAELSVLEDLEGRVNSLNVMGILLEESGDPAAAARRFAEAKELADRAGVPALANEALAGMARCALALGQLDEARQYALQVEDYLGQQGGAGESWPLRTYLTCVDVFDALDERERSRRALDTGYQKLMEQAERIDDPAWRKAFLENIPYNRALVALWERSTPGKSEALAK